MAIAQRFWSHTSVIALGRGIDPVEAITEKARTLTLTALQEGWSGPPFDPFYLAALLKIPVSPREDIAEARTVPAAAGLMIEFNPNRPRNRVRYSLCHELAHTLFPDCAERVRNRLTHEKMKGDDWQLEMLCNVAAAELLMPIGSLPPLEGERLSVDLILELRKRYEASAESVLLRAIKLTGEPCLAFSASRQGAHVEGRYAVEYSVPSRTWAGPRIPPGFSLPANTVAGECSAIGFTAKGQEQWAAPLGRVKVECVGIASYPNEVFPRVIGIVHPQRQASAARSPITYLRGDATKPRGSGARLIVQVVNDRAIIWGAGFARVVRKTWPLAQGAFRTWALNGRNLVLGNVHFQEVDESLTIASMVCQHGFGPSPKPRIRYLSLEKCLEQVAGYASSRKATIHMPRIGCGQAGGSWSIVSELIENMLSDKGLNVTVYDLPGQEFREKQPSLEFADAPSS